MKKILFVISYLDKGGAERVLSNITTHFPAGWDIDILVNDDKVIDYPFKGNILTLGITGKPKTGSILFQFKVFLKRIRRLKHLKKKEQYIACISFLDSANIANILSGKKRCKVITSVHCSLLQQSAGFQYRYIVNPLVRFLYNKADKIVAVSDGIREELINHFHLYPDKVVTVENGCDLLIIQELAKEELTGEEGKWFAKEKVIVTTGRLEEQKGQWHLIRAFAEVVRQIPDAVLFIIGSGELEDYLKKLVKEGGIEKCVYFTGFVSNPYKYMSRAQLFVLPSLYEGFPNALAEAVCLDLPCIATDFRTGAREILSPAMCKVKEPLRQIGEVEYGILTPPCTGKRYKDITTSLEKAEKNLAEVMLMLLKDEKKRIEYKRKSELRKNALAIDAVVDKWFEVIGNS